MPLRLEGLFRGFATEGDDVFQAGRQLIQRGCVNVAEVYSGVSELGEQHRRQVLGMDRGERRMAKLGFLAGLSEELSDFDGKYFQFAAELIVLFIFQSHTRLSNYPAKTCCRSIDECPKRHNCQPAASPDTQGQGSRDQKRHLWGNDRAQNAPCPTIQLDANRGIGLSGPSWAGADKICPTRWNLFPTGPSSERCQGTQTLPVHEFQ
jgi:hypothetical protein